MFRLYRRYRAHDTAQQGAALAYYLMFSLFPILILVSSLIGRLRLDPEVLLGTVEPVLPREVLAVVSAYLVYVSDHVSGSMLWFSVVFSIWFPMRATGCLMRAVRRAYDLGPPKKRVRYIFRTFLYTLLLLFTLVLTLLLMTLGGALAQALGRALALPEQIVLLWGIVRFALLGLIIFASLGVLYAIAQDTRKPLRTILPGAILSGVAWCVISTVYAFYVENISNYSAIYGALGAVVVLLIWLYLSAIALILGAEINHVLLHWGEEN